ncbi:MAG: RidA family protein [Chlorobi bacterium]|nr:RidA family protein [Chlorobiota bacterium]
MNTNERTVSTKNAPAAIGPYSQAVRAGDMLFVSGQLGLDPASGAFAADDVAGQTRQALANMRAILEAGGFTMEDVARCTVFLKSMDDFAAMNEVYATFFPSDPPSRAAVEVSRLPKDALVEITCIAVR